MYPFLYKPEGNCIILLKPITAVKHFFIFPSWRSWQTTRNCVYEPGGSCICATGESEWLPWRDPLWTIRAFSEVRQFLKELKNKWIFFFCPFLKMSFLHICRPLNKTYQEVLRTVFMSSTSSPSGANKKKSTKDVQEEITNLYNNIRLFEKGTKLFSGNSLFCYSFFHK